jgi:GLPGLI family protein
MKRIIVLIALIFITKCLQAQQRIIAECTINYSIVPSDTASVETKQILKSSTKTVYIKGNSSRADLTSPSFNQSIIYDRTSGEATVLREFGSNKFITKLDNDKWKEENKKFDGLTIEATEIRKKIAGYDCKRSIIHLKDGSNYFLFYTSAITPSVKEFEYQFKNIPGLVLEYEAVGASGEKVTYTATKVNLSPVPTTFFNVPTSGYRVL